MVNEDECKNVIERSADKELEMGGKEKIENLSGQNSLNEEQEENLMFTLSVLKRYSQTRH